MNNLQTYNLTDLSETDNLYLYFNLEKEKYAVKVSNVLEIINLSKLEYPQKLPCNILGLLKYNNFTVNVLDIRFYLDIEPTPYKASSKLLILKTDESIFALICDNVCDIVLFENSKIERLPFTSEERLIDSFYHLDEKTISVINPYSLESFIKKGTVKKEYDVQSLFPKDDESRYLIEKRTKDFIEKNNFEIMKNAFIQDSFISFELNQNLCGINLQFVKEVLKNANITHVPCAPDYVEGVITLRGDFITVINLKKFLGLSSDAENEKNRVILVQNEDYVLGFLVDNIYEIINIPENEEGNKFYGIASEFVEKEIAKDNELYLILDMSKIFADERLFIND